MWMWLLAPSGWRDLCQPHLCPPSGPAAGTWGALICGSALVLRPSRVEGTQQLWDRNPPDVLGVWARHQGASLSGGDLSPSRTREV